LLLTALGTGPVLEIASADALSQQPQNLGPSDRRAEADDRRGDDYRPQNYPQPNNLGLNNPGPTNSGVNSPGANNPGVNSQGPNPAATPELDSLVLFGIGALGLLGYLGLQRRRRHA
jgi:hypothetical protein